MVAMHGSSIYYIIYRYMHDISTIYIIYIYNIYIIYVCICIWADWNLTPQTHNDVCATPFAIAKVIISEGSLQCPLFFSLFMYVARVHIYIYIFLLCYINLPLFITFIVDIVWERPTDRLLIMLFSLLRNCFYYTWALFSDNYFIVFDKEVYRSAR